MSNLLLYTLRIADNALILGQRMSEWCSKGPTLEEDIAMSNIALDLFGQSNGFYEYAAKIDGKRSIDDLAFRRHEREFYNFQLVEQKNGHFGDTMIRHFLYDTFNYLFYTELSKSADETLSALAQKSLKEVKYHLKHSGTWIKRLGDGTEESNKKIQKSLDEIWQYTDELFEVDNLDKIMINKNIGVNNHELQKEWNNIVNNILKEANLKRPESTYMKTGGKKGIHTENLGYILAEMQYLQRSYPDAKW